MEKIKTIFPSETYTPTAHFSPRKYIKQEPYINDTGIWIPTEEYVPEGCTSSTYKCLITKELFVEAFNKWIG